MKTRLGRISFQSLPKVFNGLYALLPLRPIHDDVDLRNARELIDALAGHKLTKDQEEFLEALSTLVGAYEDEHHHADLSGVTPLEALRYLVEANGLTASALGELLGNRSVGSKLLRGERELSKVHVRTLAAHFKVDPALFLG